MTPIRAVTAALATVALALPLHAEPIAEGAALPAVDATTHEGKTLALATAASKGWTLVYFYPKADTPGCTKQACSLRDAYEELGKQGVTIYGVSLDEVAAQKAFKEKYQLPFTLISDKDAKVADAFGVPHTMGVAKRQAFLFKDGKLVWRDLSASTDKQAADVLEVLRKQK